MLNVQKILVVEDDLAISEFVSEFLSEEGYEVTTCSSGGAALLELAKTDMM
jgi:DNA-binding response OmpR family regulator